MLHSLVINNFVLFEQQEVEFTENFIAISGQSGSGKSLFIKAMLFVLGEKADFLTENRANDTSVSASFCVAKNNILISQLLNENNIDFDQENLLIRRIITKDNKNKIYVNDVVVTITFLKKLASLMVEIHSQNKQFNDFEPEFCLQIIDRLANHEVLQLEVKNLFSTYKEVLKEIIILEKEHNNLAAEINHAKEALLELDKYNFVPDEEEQLTKIKKDQSHLNERNKLFQLIKYQLFADNFTDRLIKIQRDLVKFPNVEIINNDFEQLFSILDLINDHLAEAEVAQDSEFDLVNIEERLSKIKELSRKYRVNFSDLLLLKAKFAQQVLAFDNYQLNLKKLQNKKEEIFSKYKDLAKTLSNSRRKSADILTNRILAEFKDLYLEKADFKVEFEQLLDSQMNESGLDQVNFMIKTNHGFNFNLIKAIASGGELSRIMLALKVSLVFDEQKNLFIFDEIDAGTSGEVVKAIAKKIETLAETIQIIVISHNPQILSKAKQNLHIYKTHHEHKTTAIIKNLSLDETKRELINLFA